MGCFSSFEEKLLIGDDAFPDMSGDTRFDAFALMGYADIELCRIGAIIPDGCREALISIFAKRIANVGLLAVCEKLHGWIGLIFCQSLHGGATRCSSQRSGGTIVRRFTRVNTWYKA